MPDNALLLTFDDGYIDNYTVVFPLLKSLGLQGSFFVPAKTFSENVLLDVNKIHFTLACADNPKLLMTDLLSEIDRIRANGRNDFPSNDELIEQYARASRFDNKETIFIKRILQTVLPEDIRNIIAGRLFAKYVGIDESKFARELYMNRDQIKLMKDEGMFIGLHGYDHYWLGNLSIHKMHTDIDKMLDVMSDFIDPQAWVLNYPYGNYSQAVIDYVERKGCKLGMTTEVRVADLSADNRFLLPRLDCNDFPPKSNNYKSF